MTLICPVVWATDSAEKSNFLSDTSVVDKNGSASDVKVPGLFVPVIFTDGKTGFYYSSQKSDTILLAGGDAVIIPRFTKSLSPYDDKVILRFDRQDSQIVPQGENPYSGKAAFFTGNDPSQWRTNISIYHSVAYQEIYPGIRLTYSDNRGELKSEFLIAPAADPAMISYSYEGSRTLGIDESGALHIETGQGGYLVDSPPNAYQVIGGSITQVPVQYLLSDDHHVRFALGKYDKDYPVLIDPQILTSSYLGGDVEDVGTKVAVDDKGTVYVVGYTHSKDFPVTQHAFNETEAGYHDIFITAWGKQGTEILFSTFIGGALNDYVKAVAVDANGTIYIPGSTESPDFPVKSAFQPQLQGKYDAFITAIRPGGGELAFSSFLGGSDIDDAFGIALGGPENRIYLTGTTLSQDFPVLYPVQNKNAGQYDVFLTVIDSSGKALVASTFLGGRQDDYGRAIAVDTNGNIYIGGYTYSSKSSDFPVKNAFSGPHTMTYDAFASKFSPDAKDLIYSTYFGGTMGDRVAALALDRKNQLYLTGYTFADDFPTTADAFQRNYGGNLLADAFVVGLSADGQSLMASTYLGGSKDDMGYGITIGDDGTIFVTGGTMSPDFPVSHAWQKNLNGTMNVFVAGLNPACSRTIFSSYLGGEGSDTGASIAHDKDGLLYITGTTGSEQFPVIRPVQSQYHGDDDAFLTILSPGGVSHRIANMNLPVIPLFSFFDNNGRGEGRPGDTFLQ
ncbi:MAG: SBBP repeat-containing protein [Methanoregula sp.]